ncbi:MAG TPA: tetratricopeptide repeat protein [Methylomirabilota bacterium]|nr:tetratricopeptide repeat protein [Methylomirabilota bacterium]
MPHRHIGALRRVVAISAIALIQAALGSPAMAGPRPAAETRTTPTTVTVMPFVPRSGQGQAWLSKGLADLLIQDLAQVKSLTIVSREQAQVFARELQLGDSPLFGPETALRMGRVAKVDRVLYGHYALTGERIAITIFVLDMARQEVIQREDVEGTLRDLRPLVQKLALQFTGRQGIELSEAERANIRFETTDSITATRHFYEGLHLYDLGRHADALGEFSAAAKQDPRYREAQLWVGKVFESLGSHEHAVVTYRALYRDAPATVEGMDGLYFAGRVLEEQLKRRPEAIDAYQTLAKLRPITPQVLEAAFRLGVLLGEEGRDRDAYLALRLVDDFHERARTDSTLVSRSRARASRFLAWPHAMELHRDAIVRMVLLYQRMTQGATGALPPAPRGVFLVTPQRPVIGEPFGKTPALFQPRDDEGTRWRERHYAVVVPAGYVATGVEMSIRGRLVVAGPHFEYAIRVLDFPMPREAFRRWLGAIYGQTPQVADLSKTVSFNGDDRRVFTVQVFGGQAEIERWGLRVRLRRETEQARLEPAPTPEEDGSFWEGRPTGRVVLPRRVGSGWTRPMTQALHGPQKELAISDDGRGGYFLVTVEGELDGQPTDLWWSRSVDGAAWSEAAPLPINSASEDYNPRLVSAEDGTLWLYWISTRRGLGWELWASSSRDGRSWSDPQRVPLEQFVAPPAPVSRAASLGQRLAEQLPASLRDRWPVSQVAQRLEEGGPSPAVAAARPITELLEYDVMQDRRGRFLVSFYSRDTREMVFIRSTDGAQWTLLSRVPSGAVLGPALAEDRGGIFRLAALGPGETVYLWSSKDGIAWRPKSEPIDSPYGTSTPVHRTYLLPLPTGEMLLLVSDTAVGLQYARFQPDGEAPKLDRVSRAALEPFAVTPTRSGSYLVALRQSDEILVREYRAFNTTGVGVKKYEPDWPIYVEEDRDRAENRWRRMSARARMIIPDVTSVGVEPNGRVWWGIESGIMAKTGEDFFATDVSQGFFYHYVTVIKGCGGIVWFAADHLDRPVVGYVRTGTGASFEPRFVTRAIPGASGAVTAAECGPNPGELYVGTSRGDVARVNAAAVRSRWSLEGAPRITALTVEPRTGTVWVGTRDQGLFQIEGETARRVSAKANLLDREITALAVDSGGALWVALYGKGLARRIGEHWTAFTPKNSPLPDWSIGQLAPGLSGGVWYIAHAEARSRGVGFFDGTRGRVNNPPHTILDRPSSIAVDPRGHVWIGTWFDGLYELEPAGAKK